MHTHIMKCFDYLSIYECLSMFHVPSPTSHNVHVAYTNMKTFGLLCNVSGPRFLKANRILIIALLFFSSFF